MHDSGLVAGLLIALLLSGGGPVYGQDASTEGRDRFAISVGGLWYESPDWQCRTDIPAGYSVGVEARTGGAWFLAGGADLLLGGVSTCTLVLEDAEWQGRRVHVERAASLGLAPRVGLRGSRAIQIGEVTVTPGIGIGLLYVQTDFRDRDGGYWSSWYGASVGVRTPALPVSFRAEYGSLDFPVRYYGGEDFRQVVHEFTRRVPLLRVTAVF